MNIRTQSALSVCVMYALLIAACVGYVSLGLPTGPFTRESLVALPIFFQLIIAEVLGLTPLLEQLAQATHWTVLYLSVVLCSFFMLYWVGWWVGELNDESAWAPLAQQRGQHVPSAMTFVDFHALRYGRRKTGARTPRLYKRVS